MSGGSTVLTLAMVASLGVGLASTGGGADGPFRFHSLTPCRIVDTRVVGTTWVKGGAYGPILTSGVERVFPVQGNCGVPAGARAATLNLTAVAPTNQGRLTAYPSGISTPEVSTINFPPGTTALANGAIVPLGDGVPCPAGYVPDTCDLTVMPFVFGGGQVHLVLDVTGYFQ